MNTNKIKDILSLRYEKIRSDLWDRLKPKDHNGDFDRSLEAVWVEYLNGIDCEVVHPDDILEEFENLFNYSSKTRICVLLDDLLFGEETYYILMPKQLAEKALVLDGLPDFWSPEEKPETSFR